jgi:hypothetical protein
MWVLVVKNHRASRLKYNAFVSDWTFAGPDRRLRAIIKATYTTGPHYIYIPRLEQVDWLGPARHVVVEWPQTGPLQTTLDSDGWALGDGALFNMPLAPNPMRDSEYFNLNNDTIPRGCDVTFGWILPPFENVSAWDPTILMSLFTGSTPNPDPASPPTPKSNFDKNSAVIVGCVVGGVVLIVAAVIGGYLIYTKTNDKNSKRVHVTQ